MKQLLLLSTLLLLTFFVIGQTSDKLQTTGPEHGTLIIIGGGMLDEAIYERFLQEAGGDTAHIVVIPTALGDEYLKQDSAFIKLRQLFEGHGFKDVTLLHTRDTAKANDADFIAPLKTATGIYFMGGRQWRIADGFLDTRAHQEMNNLLARGGVIAGSSAGATIQGSYLARGDTKNNQIMMGDHEEGLAFIKNVAIDQHVLARNRQFDLFTILDKRPELLGIGLDENTAIVVKGDTFEVIGESYVLMYDQSFWSREGSALKNLPDEERMFYLLRAGDRYNLREREVIAD
ncbi:MAG: cyanophycinase [Bacteroidota bacterium]